MSSSGGSGGFAASRPVAVLIGPPGSGKTVTGRALAALLEVSFHDTDEHIVAVGGRPIADIFVDDGEAAFRALERAEVARALAQEPGVVSLGGGAPVDEQTRALLVESRDGGAAGGSPVPVVFLDVGIADAARRIGFDQSRPLLAVNPRASWIAMMAQRRPVYEGLATHTVDTAGRTPQAVAEAVAELLHATDSSSR